MHFSNGQLTVLLYFTQQLNPRLDFALHQKLIISSADASTDRVRVRVRVRVSVRVRGRVRTPTKTFLICRFKFTLDVLKP